MFLVNYCGNFSRNPISIIQQALIRPEVKSTKCTKELKVKMELKNILCIEDMLEMAQLEGVKFLACKTSVDLFDLNKDDFIEGVEIMLASDFMKQATGTDLHLAL